ncbi:MAG TPA: OsmC family protein [Terriglobales bacterium]|jgi:putative redox protein|nr:OsmC family protein [Terriglobales bacterium]
MAISCHNHSGFRPHDLLEAALATCANISVRMYAADHGIPLRNVTTTVSLDKSHSDEVVFRYTVCLDGDLTEEHKDRLLQAVGACPVRRTLSRKISFELGPLA